MHPVFKTFSTFRRHYVYDRNTNSIVELSKADYELLRKIEHGDMCGEAEEVLLRLQKSGLLLAHEVREIEHPCSACYEDYINRKTTQITLQVTQNCNLRCDYCAYTGSYHNRLFSDRNMSWDIAKKAIDYIYSHSCEKTPITIGFYGGEPILNIGLIKQCVNYVVQHYSEKETRFTLTTNGTMLTDSVAAYLFENNFNIMISLDGTKEMHDRHRKYPDGSGSFDQIMKNLLRIKEKYPAYYKQIMINTVLSPTNDLGCIREFYDTDEILEFYSPQFTLLSEFGAKEKARYSESYMITSRTERLKALLWIIGKIDRKCVSSLFLRENSMLQHTKKNLASIDALPAKCHPGGPCMAGISRVFCDVDGYLYPCERVNEKSGAMRIGHIDSGIDLGKARKLINVARITEEACKNCWAFIHCSQCAAAADDNGTLSKEQRLGNCARNRSSALQQMRDFCFVTEQGIDLEDMEG